MKMRKGAPLLFALVALLGAAQAASASHCGFFPILELFGCVQRRPELLLVLPAAESSLLQTRL